MEHSTQQILFDAFLYKYISPHHTSDSFNVTKNKIENGPFFRNKKKIKNLGKRRDQTARPELG